MNLLGLLQRIVRATTFDLNVDIALGFSLAQVLDRVLMTAEDLLLGSRPEDFMDDPNSCEGCGMTVDPQMGCVEGADDFGDPFYYHLDCAPVESEGEEDD